jgi:hypothetical protein
LLSRPPTSCRSAATPISFIAAEYARNRHYEAMDSHDALAEQLLKMTAATVHGVLAKARVLRRDFLTEESLDADLQEQLDRIGPQSEAFTISIARDMLRLADGEANG